MEEVDNIIIDSLKNLSSNVDEDVQSLKEFTSEMVYSSMVACLEAILPNVQLPRSLPQSMSLRLKHATTVAEHVKELGYKGDMGYQTILYCNEIEIRRVLMFLVERLPRETHKLAVNTELGYVPKLVKKIEESIRLSLEKLWVPSVFLKDGIRNCGSTDLKLDFSSGHNLQTESIYIPNTQMQDCSEGLRQYWATHLPVVTQQCSSKNLIPSLLFRDCEFEEGMLNKMIAGGDLKLSIMNEVEVKLSEETNVSRSENNEPSKFDSEVQDICSVIEENKEKHKELKAAYDNFETQLAQIIDLKNKKNVALKESLSKIKTRSKTLRVLQNKENLVKLKNLVDNGNKKLVELANHWNHIQTPLLKEYEVLQQRLNSEKLKAQNVEQRHQNTKDKKASLLKELSAKEKMEVELTAELEKLNKNTNRSAYTRRILEIIANIKKQNDEIQKILLDTKIVQKEINNLNGQLDRSFALSDELIFRDAKRDTMARSAYKLLATLHNDCGDVVQAVTNLGLVERECRTVQEQIEAELAREISSKLERLNKDILEMRKENATLITKIKEHNR
ncbi:hypothetical protein FQA39_LY10322 [Lamprigera yunnana]|nr:hypothetical protein FQA39_LY10322 [Lamprigera yunnana]